MKKICLTIAGSDSSGGAGIQADIKAMEANNVFAMSAITGITAQNSKSVTKVKVLENELIAEQIDCLFLDYKIAGVKIGALFNEAIISLVAEKIKKYQVKKIVLDPVMVSKSKSPLLEEKSVRRFIKEFAGIDLLLTPNIDEVNKMLNMEIKEEADIKKAITAFWKLGFHKVLIKGGHMQGEKVIDYFTLEKNGFIHQITNQRINSKNTHGTGCSLSSAIVAFWVQTNDLKMAIERGVEYVHEGIKKGLNYGSGYGPINHFWKDNNDFKRKKDST